MSPEVLGNLHIVLYSGGMDSYITYKYVGRSSGDNDIVYPVYFSLGHRYEHQELAAVANTLGSKVMRDFTLKGLGKVEDYFAHIPGRNAHLVLASLKYAVVKSSKVFVWLTVQKDEMSIPDRSEEFFEKMSEVCSVLVGSEVLVATPFRDMDKADMVAWYLSKGYSVDELLSTWACYNSTSYIPCGECSACIRRYIALSINGLSEEYRIDPLSSSLADSYRKAAKLGEYSEQRCGRILEVLGE
jgi:7-cyano-7-deazaguanine synthase in queuosine biosynthesis